MSDDMKQRRVPRYDDAALSVPIDDRLAKLIAESKVKLAAMTEEERVAMWQAQRESYARGEASMGETAVVRPLTQSELASLPRPAHPPLTLGYITVRSLERCFRWHGKSGVRHWTPERWLLAAAGELGEAANAMKKLWRIDDNMANKSDDAARQIDNAPQAIDYIGREICDTILYLVMAAARLDIDLEATMVKVFNATSEKYGFPDRL